MQCAVQVVLMRENVSNNDVFSKNSDGSWNVQLREFQDEDILMSLSQSGDYKKFFQETEDVSHSIGNYRVYRAEHCVCSSKMHYEIDGGLVCIRNMKPFAYVVKYFSNMD